MPWLAAARPSEPDIDWDAVRSVAEQIRGGMMEGQFAEREVAKGHPFFGGRPYPENPDEWRGQCVSAALLLAETTHDMGYAPAIVEGEFTALTPEGSAMSEAHYWVELGGKIVDLTADQFNSRLSTMELPPMPRVNIVPASDEHYVAGEVLRFSEERRKEMSQQLEDYIQPP